MDTAVWHQVLADLMLIIFMGVITRGLSANDKLSTNDGIAVCSSASCEKVADDLLLNLNFSVDPCKDFYSFVCGRWIKNNPIPPSEAQWNQFDVTIERVDKILKGLLEEPHLSDDSPPIVAAKDMYGACMDVRRIEQEGLQPLVQISDELGGWPMANRNWTGNNFDWTTVLVKMTKDMELSPLFALGVSFDRKNTSQRVIIIDQPTLKLGLSRAMLVEAKKYPAQVEAYQKWIVNTAREFARAQGYTLPAEQAAAEARVLVEFEMNLTLLTAGPELRRNQYRKYNPMTLKDLHAKTDSDGGVTNKSRIDWVSFVQRVFANADVKIGPDERVVIREVNFLVNLTKLLDTTPLRVLANFLQWQLIKTFGVDTTEKMRYLRLEFAKVLHAIQVLAPRWRICVSRTSQRLAMATSYMYVKKVFDRQSRRSAISMVTNIRAAFLERMHQADWMEEETKRTALEKAFMMKEFIGYPDWFHNSSALESYYDWVSVGKSHFKNIAFFKSTESLRMMNKLRKPIDRSEWTLPPDVVNAFYSPPANSIVLPAGILQPPFFQHSDIMSLNYGSIGSVVGHEMTHGFDDIGSQSDKLGNLVQWWSKPTFETFINKTQCFINQYGNYTIPELNNSQNTTTKMNGKNTRGENVADNGGLQSAFLAYQKAIEAHGPEPRLSKLKQFSPNQLFFIGFASIWCESVSKESLLRYLTVDVHSQHRARVTGTVSNSQDFAHAFQCPVGSPMNPRVKCSMW